MTFLLAIFPITHIIIPRRVNKLTYSMLLSLKIFTLIIRTIRPIKFTLSTHLSLYPVPHISIIIRKSELSMPFRQILIWVNTTFINFTIRVVYLGYVSWFGVIEEDCNIAEDLILRLVFGILGLASLHIVES
jgi:hypothetical protein